MTEHRWGIIGCGKIASDFVTSLKLVPNAKVVACAARTKEGAEDFGKRFQIPKCYGSYKQLVEDTEVTLVYVGTLHPSHYEHATLALEHGKPVLCEKPLCINTEQAKKLRSFASEKKVFLMEAMWSRYLPAYKHLISLMEEKAIGEVKFAYGTFGGEFETNNPRNFDKKLGAGSLLDIGIYLVTVSHFIFGKEPSTVVSLGDVRDGVDRTASFLFGFEEGKQASYTCSIVTNMKNEIVILGSKGKITVHSPFWCSEKLTIETPGKTLVLDFPIPKVAGGVFNFSNSSGLHFEAVHAQECVEAGKLESSLWNLDNTLAVLRTLDTIRKQLNVIYPDDHQ
eukprot:TRINITY_DN4094_c0_g1_i1.p1 TRINITY_DN4094_c0_g1~~TRINITY_DN4094_c0_g1_i1.p1  ORF type:complete len:338 (-),score=63.51 TRINITY_DN4094_c0_g1_i1:78-1091(-)